MLPLHLRFASGSGERNGSDSQPDVWRRSHHQRMVVSCSQWTMHSGQSTGVGFQEMKNARFFLLFESGSKLFAYFGNG
ncbi:hypothetical protein JTE90_007874 [Oedothorax gibbosus]|uniref:Uncharacterized protein n=1 Tax=Oedothorax gibbosus TaxID=931172 RepID=A0AAV6VHG8_9ARAC|nr:hypothetical protein JTE90_007874 [Oedothorax gibbosus]